MTGEPPAGYGWHVPRSTRVLLAVLAAGAVVVLGGSALLSRPALALAGTGAVLDPPGRVTTDSDGAVVVAYPPREVAHVRLRLPVRNTSRFTVTVTYPEDAGPPHYDGWPSRTVRIPPHRTAWLDVAVADHGCAGTRATDSWMVVSGIGVEVRPRFAGMAHHETVPLPVRVQVPGLDWRNDCRPPDPTPVPHG
ncbi:MAG TPA: hypothetical protein VFQ85_10835 [Mycobacteriales bacterium]|nr:hypothetical protein [Mycobacteriales bacterium]